MNQIADFKCKGYIGDQSYALCLGMPQSEIGNRANFVLRAKDEACAFVRVTSKKNVRTLTARPSTSNRDSKDILACDSAETSILAFFKNVSNASKADVQ